MLLIISFANCNSKLASAGKVHRRKGSWEFQVDQDQAARPLRARTNSFRNTSADVQNLSKRRGRWLGRDSA